MMKNRGKLLLKRCGRGPRSLGPGLLALPTPLHMANHRELLRADALSQRRALEHFENMEMVRDEKSFIHFSTKIDELVVAINKRRHLKRTLATVSDQVGFSSYDLCLILLTSQ